MNNPNGLRIFLSNILIVFLAVPLMSANLKLIGNSYFSGDIILIEGKLFSELTNLQIDEIYYTSDNQAGTVHQSQSVISDSEGSFSLDWKLTNDLSSVENIEFRATDPNTGLGTSTFLNSSSTILQFETTFNGLVCPDTLSSSSVIEFCAGLYQECEDGSLAPLAGRTLELSPGFDDCGLDAGESPNLFAVTDESGLACFSIGGIDTLYSYGSLSVRVKYAGERAPEAGEQPNSACNPSESVNFSSANDCFFIEILHHCDSSILPYEIVGNDSADIYYVKTVDLDRDNHTDIIYTGNSIEGLFIAFGTGESNPEQPISYLAIKQAALDVGYVNADTLVDIIAVTLNNIYILYNLGNRNFDIESIPITNLNASSKYSNILLELNAPSFVTGHFNSDIYVDLIIAPDQIRYGNDLNVFNSGISLGTNFKAVNSCDFNNDGYDDVIGIDGDSTKILLNDTNGGFQQSVSIFVGDTKIDLTPASIVVDFNDDGNCDFAQVVPLTNSTNESMITYALGDGTGSLLKSDTIRVYGIAYNLAVADADRDGNLEMIIANGTTQKLEIYFGDGSGNFEGPSYVDLQTSNSQTYALASLDLDRDGNFDFISGALNGGDLLVATTPSDSADILIDQMTVTAFDETTVRVYNPDGYIISEDIQTVAGSEFQELDVDSDGSLDDRTMDYNLEYGEYVIVADMEPEASDEGTMSIAIGINGSQQAISFLNYNASGNIKTLVDSLVFYYTVEEISSIQPPNGMPTDRSRPLFEWDRQVDTIANIEEYQIQLDRYYDFRNPIFDITGLLLPEYQPEVPLGNDSVFYWRYKYNDGNSWSDYSRTFAVYITGVCCFGFTGNVNGDTQGVLDMSDITFLVDYLFLGGPHPPCSDASNVNGDPEGEINIIDLAFLVRYVFDGGAPPMVCP